MKIPILSSKGKRDSDVRPLLNCRSSPGLPRKVNARQRHVVFLPCRRSLNSSIAHLFHPSPARFYSYCLLIARSGWGWNERRVLPLKVLWLQVEFDCTQHIHFGEYRHLNSHDPIYNIVPWNMHICTMKISVNSEKKAWDKLKCLEK
jgi:hypothetical protein